MSQKVLLFLLVLISVVTIGLTIAPRKPQGGYRAGTGTCTKRNVNATCGQFCEETTCERGSCVCTSPLLTECEISKNRKCKKFAKSKDLIGMSCKAEGEGRRKPSYCVVYLDPNSTTEVPDPVDVEVPTNPDPEAEVPPSEVSAESGNDFRLTHQHTFPQPNKFQFI